MLLNKANLAIAKIADKTGSRYSLSSIQVTAADTRATDGTVTIIVTREQMSADNFPIVSGINAESGTNPILLASKDALAIAKALPKKIKIPILNSVIVGEAQNGTRSLGVSDGSCSQVISTKIPEGRFPNLDQCFEAPALGPPPVCFTVDAKKLIALLETILECSSAKDLCPVTFTFFDSNHPVRLDAANETTGQQISAVIMSMSPESAIIPRQIGKVQVAESEAA